MPAANLLNGESKTAPRIYVHFDDSRLREAVYSAVIFYSKLRTYFSSQPSSAQHQHSQRTPSALEPSDLLGLFQLNLYRPCIALAAQSAEKTGRSP